MKTDSPRQVSTATKTTRIQIQTATVVTCRPLIDRLVRDLVPARRRREGAQVAAIGVLVALERFDFSRGPSLVSLAERCALSEIRRWQSAVSK